MKEIGNKKAIRVAWSFMMGNITLTLIALSILIVFGLMQYIPIVGFIFAMAYSILNFSIQIYMGRAVLENNSESEIQDVASKTNVNEFFTKYIDIAAGGFLGFFTIMILSFFILMMIVMTNLDSATIATINQNGISETSVMTMAQNSTFIYALLIFMLIGLILSYAIPAVMGKVFLAEDFFSAFKNSFLIFAPSLWKRVFNKEYFKLIFIWSIVIFFSAIIISQFFKVLITIPIALILLYLLSLYNSVIYIYSIIAIEKS